MTHHFTFVQGNPVPDGVPFSEISLANHPSNIAVFEAADLTDAMNQAVHGFRHGMQGAVWLANQGISTVEGLEERIQRIDEVTRFINSRTGALEGMRKPLNISSVTTRHRIEHCSNFVLHVDGGHEYPVLRLTSTHYSHLRVLFNIHGTGTVLFGRNSVLAKKLVASMFSGENLDVWPEDLGHAYIAPHGSVSFIMGVATGHACALIHAHPHVQVKERYDEVRELAVMDCDLAVRPKPL